MATTAPKKDVSQVRPKKIQVNLGGKKHTLIFDLNAMGLVEEQYDTVEDAFNLMDEGKIIPVRFCLWASLQPEADEKGEEITEHQVGAWVTLANLSEVVAALLEAFMSGVPDEVRAKIEAAQKAKAEGKPPKGDSGNVEAQGTES